MNPRIARTVVLAALLALLSLPAAAQAAHTPYVSAIPNLFPRFSPAVSDYVVRCPQDRVDVRVSGAPGWRVRVGGGRARSGTFTATVPVLQSRGFSIAMGGPRGRRRTHFVRCLPTDFPRWVFERHATPAHEYYLVAPGLDLAAQDAGHFAIIFDAHGVPVWWHREPAPVFDVKELEGGIAWTSGNDKDFRLRRLDGTLVRRIRTVGTEPDFHDLQPAPGGRYLLLAYKIREARADLRAYGGTADERVVDNEIQEVDAQGRLTWRWSTEGNLDPAETGRWYRGAIRTPEVGYNVDGTPEGTLFDLFHANSVEPAPNGDVVASFRHLDAILRIGRDGRIRWKLGGTERPESLRVIGNTRPNLFGGQHDARLDGDTLTVYDNGTEPGRRQSLPPRLIRLRIDEAARTATVIEEVVEPEAPTSFCCGSARRLENGNWLSSWGGNNIVGEYTAAGRPVMRLRFDGFFTYRATSVPRGTFSRSALRRGMSRIAAAGAG